MMRTQEKKIFIIFYKNLELKNIIIFYIINLLMIKLNPPKKGPIK